MDNTARPNYQAENRPKHDKCNICGKSADLTEDHVPPKFWHNSKEKRYSQGLGTYDPLQTEKAFPWKSRKGIVFRSICGDCNNRILGSSKDKALQEFCDQVRNHIINHRIYTSYINCSIDANLTAKAVTGHMLAAKGYYDDKTTVDKILREYVLDDAALPPDDMQLLYFYYPWQYIVVGRDIVVSRLGKNEDRYAVPEGMISCIYSFPLAFILTDKKQNLHMLDLFSYCRNGVVGKQDVLFNYKSMYYPGTNEVRNPFWPANISDDKDGTQMLLGGKSLQNMIIGIGEE